MNDAKMIIEARFDAGQLDELMRERDEWRGRSIDRAQELGAVRSTLAEVREQNADLREQNAAYWNRIEHLAFRNRKLTAALERARLLAQNISECNGYFAKDASGTENAVWLGPRLYDIISSATTALGQ